MDLRFTHAWPEARYVPLLPSGCAIVFARFDSAAQCAPVGRLPWLIPVRFAGGVLARLHAMKNKQLGFLFIMSGRDGIA
jgi:hypothetical protein